jgi:hypothetical protein
MFIKNIIVFSDQKCKIHLSCLAWPLQKDILIMKRKTYPKMLKCDLGSMGTKISDVIEAVNIICPEEMRHTNREREREREREKERKKFIETDKPVFKLCIGSQK